VNKEKESHMIEAKGLTPRQFLDKVLEPDKESDHICWQCEDSLALLLVRGGLQRGEKVLRL
jgi:hypothetical protein